MPVYLRKDQTWTPASLTNETFCLNDDDFIQDPDQHRDQLPQPYRMIDKVLGHILDSVWDHISDRESDRVAEASRYRAPQYECGIHIQDDNKCLVKTECMIQTPDGKYVVVGLEDGLCVIKSDSQQIIDVWSEEGLHVANLKVSSLGEEKYLIVATDDMGAAKIFALAGEQIYFVTPLNNSESGTRSIVSKVELASDGDYVAVFTERPSSQEGWVEIHRLPKDSWIKDLDRLVIKVTQKDVSSTANQPPKTPTDDSVPAEVAQMADTADRDNTADDSQRAQSPGDTVTQKPSHSFTATTIIIKVLPPSPLTGSSYSSVASASKALDNHGEVLGTGAHHLISSSHLDQRTEVFSQLHSDNVKYLAQGEQRTISQPTMHFVRSGRMLSHSSDDGPTAVAIWWTSETQFLAYSLHKTSKDLEHKPSLVLPISSKIVCSAVSPDGSQVALCTDNNNLIVWDLYLGSPKGVVHLPPEDLHVTRISFLSPSVCPQDSATYPPYPTTTAYYLLICRDDGRAELVNVGRLGEPPVVLDLDIVRPEEVPTLCEPVDGIPDLLLSCRKNGRIYLHDCHRGNALREVSLPPGYQLSSPWQPAIAVGNKGGMLYLKGNPVCELDASNLQNEGSAIPSTPLPSDTAQDENIQSSTKPSDKKMGEGESMPLAEPNQYAQVNETGDITPSPDDVATPEPRVFVFTLRSFPSLDKYRSRERPQLSFVVHSTAQTRVDALLANRLSQAPQRISRLQNRWDKLRDEVSTIKQLRADRQQKAATARQTFSASSIAKSPVAMAFGKSW